MSNIKKIGIITGSLYGLLGFNRGMNEYDYKYNKYYKNHKSYLYTSKISNGLYGMAIYIMPIFLMITLPREIYRLEVNIRNMEDEKQSDTYNEI